MAAHLSVGSQGDGVVGAAGHLRHLLVQEVGGHEGGGQSVVGGPVAQLAVAVVAPSEHLPICRAEQNKVLHGGTFHQKTP